MAEVGKTFDVSSYDAFRVRIESMTSPIPRCTTCYATYAGLGLTLPWNLHIFSLFLQFVQFCTVRYVLLINPFENAPIWFVCMPLLIYIATENGETGCIYIIF